MPRAFANQRLHTNGNCLCKYVPTTPSRDHVDKIWRNRNAQILRTYSNPIAWTKRTQIMKNKIQNFMKMNQIKTTFSQAEKWNYCIWKSTAGPAEDALKTICVEIEIQTRQERSRQKRRQIGENLTSLAVALKEKYKATNFVNFSAGRLIWKSTRAQPTSPSLWGLIKNDPK